MVNMDLRIILQEFLLSFSYFLRKWHGRLNNTFIQDKAIGFGDVDLGIKHVTYKINVAASLIVGH